MFERIKKAIRKRENQKKRQEIEMALPWFKSHWFWQFGKEPMEGNGEITYKDWKWFKTLVEEGTVYDLKVTKCERLHGHIIYKHVSYKVADKDRLDQVFKEHGWRGRKDREEEKKKEKKED